LSFYTRIGFILNLNVVQSGLKVGHEILNVLDTDRQADQVVMDAVSLTGLSGDGRVSHDGAAGWKRKKLAIEIVV
jgi:hypothetical protein